MRGENDPRLTVYYDGSCPLCRAEIGFYCKRDRAGRIAFTDISRSADDPAPDLDREAAMGRFHTRRPDGTLVSGAAGFFEVWKRLPGWRHLARLSRIPGVVPVAELAYRAFLRLRPALVRLLGPRLEDRTEGTR
ncbi:hypothetical protein FIU89_14955 [Roseovarius sp. THAF27]|uniref:thiol-disulfide oxidoreductase DCC family protein n=1 Tax=Roseovarius sp. THAF27 TaxID=2587850 RepID=UPI0012681155|nr:DUF393 domain-containing protein [Roseovarius sp. THAF27]QFT81921.1 hypothetical protein FIU89_14955 [Roseovarius sp. THAF27]